MNLPAPDPEFMSEEALKAAQEGKRKRRAELVGLIQDAGLNPAEIDVTKMLSDEEAAEFVRQQAARKKAQQLAETTPRESLRERLKRTVAIHTGLTPDEPVKLPSSEQLRPDAKENAPPQ